METTRDTLIALMWGSDRPGIVARTAGWIYEHGGNVLHADQHHDHEAGVFFQRIEWAQQPDDDLEALAAEFARVAETELGLETRVALASQRPRVLVMVSKIDHCFHDIVLRWKAGELKGDFVGVVSNHRTLEDVCAHYALPFHHVPVGKENKAAAEAQVLEIARREQVDLIILARYMQVLSDDFLRGFGGPVINIHHSFLPAFAGGRPYHQAYARGVKLIGATAHYATAELDAGPIIHQDVTRVSHRHGVPELIRRGRDLEKVVFAQAVRWHLDHRILVYNNKTVVLD